MSIKVKGSFPGEMTVTTGRVKALVRQAQRGFTVRFVPSVPEADAQAIVSAVRNHLGGDAYAHDAVPDKTGQRHRWTPMALSSRAVARGFDVAGPSA